MKTFPWLELIPITAIVLPLVGCAAESIDSETISTSPASMERANLDTLDVGVDSSLVPTGFFSFPATPLASQADFAHPPHGPIGAHLVFPPKSRPHGRSMAEWATRWWQWMAETPKSVAPVMGHDCNYNQTDDVFFLTGSFGTTDTRSCTIPEAKPIFFPIINVICWQVAWEGVCYNATDEELAACAGADYDGTTGAVVELEAELDGQSIPMLEAHRSGVSERFSWGSPGLDPAEYLFWGVTPVESNESNECGFPEGDRQGVTDGYWLMLKPLSPGQHSLHFVGKKTRANGTVFKVDLTYNITQL